MAFLWIKTQHSNGSFRFDPNLGIFWFFYLVSKLNCYYWAFLARSGGGFRFNAPLVTISVLRQGLAKPSRLAWDSRCLWTCNLVSSVSQLLGLHTQLQDNFKKAAVLMCPHSWVLLVVMANNHHLCYISFKPYWTIPFLPVGCTIMASTELILSKCSFPRGGLDCENTDSKRSY